MSRCLSAYKARFFLLSVSTMLQWGSTTAVYSIGTFRRSTMVLCNWIFAEVGCKKPNVEKNRSGYQAQSHLPYLPPFPRLLGKGQKLRLHRFALQRISSEVLRRVLFFFERRTQADILNKLAPTSGWKAVFIFAKSFFPFSPLCVRSSMTTPLCCWWPSSGGV